MYQELVKNILIAAKPSYIGDLNSVLFTIFRATRPTASPASNLGDLFLYSHNLYS